MNDFSNFSQFHPSWEGRDFTKEEFASLLDELNKKKPEDALLTNGKTFEIAGVARQIWQKIKGWLGLENQTDPIKVNYDLLKLLRYGETHHFFTDTQVKELIRRLIAVLNQDINHSYSKVTDLIQSILPLNDDRLAANLVDKEIRTYYVLHKDDLKASFWENLFNTYISPMHQTTANVYFNEANIACQEERYEEALKNIEKALELNPANSLGLLAKANILLKLAEKKAPSESLELKIRSLNLLKSIPKTDDINIKDIHDLIIDTYLECSSQFVKQGNAGAASHLLEELAKVKYVTPSKEQNDEAANILKMLNQLRQNATLEHGESLIARNEAEIIELPIDEPSNTLDLLADEETANQDEAEIIDPPVDEPLSTLDLLADEKDTANKQVNDEHPHNHSQEEGAEALPKSNIDPQMILADILPEEDKAIDIFPEPNFLHNDIHEETKEEKKNDPLPNDLDNEVLNLSENEVISKPSDDNNLLDLANFHLDEKNFAEALPLFEKIDATSKIYECLIGIAEQEENTAPENAIEYYKKALDLLPDEQDPIVYQEIARLYQVIEDFPSAIAFMETANRLQPENPKILADLADVYHKNKSFALAIHAYEKASQIKNTLGPFINKIIECHFELANETAENENFIDAIERYKTILALAPASNSKIADKLVKIGRRIENRHPQTAAEAYHLALPYIQGGLIGPQDLLHIYLFLANEAEKSKNIEKNVEYLELAKSINPPQIQIRKKLSNLHLLQGNLVKAESELEFLTSYNLADAEDLETLAELYLTEDRNEEALEIYQKLKIAPKIYECRMEIALQAEENKMYAKAIDCYEEALNYANRDEKQKAAANLFHLGFELIIAKENHLAKRACQLALSSAPDLSVIPQSGLFEIYSFLAGMTQENEFQIRNEYLQKALQIQPNHVNTILMKAELDKNLGNDERAIIGFEQAILLQPQNPFHQHKLITVELSLGDKYYKKGIHNPEAIKQSIIDFIAEIQTSDQAKNITNSLGAWRGENSEDNQKLSILGKNAKTPHQIAEQGLQACELLEKAYDGQGYHMKRTELPKKFTEGMQTIRKSIDLMKKYYETLQNKTEEVVDEIRNSSFADQFSGWKSIPKMADLKNADLIEAQANKCLTLINRASQKKIASASLTLQRLIENLSALTKPMGWMNNAIYHYERVLAVSNEYGQYCNHLIDAYTQIDDYASAIEKYEELKIKFPLNSIYIDYRIYAKLAAEPDKRIQISNQQLFDGLIKAADQYSREENYEAAIGSYQLALAKGNEKQSGEVALRLLNLGDKLINTSHKDLAIEAYKNALNYKSLILISSERYFKTLLPLAFHAKNKKNDDEALGYFKEVFALKPNDEVTNAELGLLYLEHNQPDAAIFHLEKAAKANPLNGNYQNQLADAENALGDRSYAAGLISHLRQSLINFIRHATTEASYASDIQNALGANLGWYSSQNKELRALGQSATTSDQIEKDSLRAIELMKTIYDGKSNHKKPEEMPEEFATKMEIFTDLLTNSQESMDEYPELFTDASINTLEDQTQKAILYYEKAAMRFPLVYNEHYNRLLNAYVLKGEAMKAFNLHKDLKVKFPATSLHLSPAAYMQLFDACISDKKYEEAFNIIQAGTQEHPGNVNLLKRLSLLYFTLGQNAFLTNDLNTAVRLYTMAAKCGVDAKVECYVNLAKIYILAMNDQAKIDFNVVNTNGARPPVLKIPNFIKLSHLEEKEYSTHFKAASEYLKKAIELSDDPELMFQLARIAYFEDKDFDVIPYAKRAAALEPKNVSYAYANMKIQTQANVHMKIKEQLLKKFKELGGKMSGNDEIYWISHNPQNFPIGK